MFYPRQSSDPGAPSAPPSAPHGGPENDINYQVCVKSFLLLAPPCCVRLLEKELNVNIIIIPPETTHRGQYLEKYFKIFQKIITLPPSGLDGEHEASCQPSFCVWTCNDFLYSSELLSATLEIRPITNITRKEQTGKFG